MNKVDAGEALFRDILAVSAASTAATEHRWPPRYTPAQIEMRAEIDALYADFEALSLTMDERKTVIRRIQNG